MTVTVLTDALLQDAPGYRFAYLRVHPLFEGLDRRAMDLLADECRVLHFARRTRLISQGTKSDWLGVIINGRAQLSCESHDGREIGLGILNPGDHFGELSVIDGQSQVADVETLTAVLVAKLPGEALRAVMHNCPALSGQLLRHCSLTIRHMTAMRVVQSHPHSVSRLCALIRLLAVDGPYRDVVNDMPTHQQTAFMINSSRETVCRMLTQLRRKGVISVRGAKLRIVDAQALETICSTNHIDAQPEQAARRPHSISA